MGRKIFLSVLFLCAGLLPLALASKAAGQSAEDILKQGLDYFYAGKNNEAFPLFQKAANMGNAKAQYELGLCYQGGFGTDQDLPKCFSWYTKSAAQGDSDGEEQLAKCYENGWGVDKDLDKAKQWYQASADQGNKESMDALKNLGGSANTTTTNTTTNNDTNSDSDVTGDLISGDSYENSTLTSTTGRFSCYLPSQPKTKTYDDGYLWQCLSGDNDPYYDYSVQYLDYSKNDTRPAQEILQKIAKSGDKYFKVLNERFFDYKGFPAFEHKETSKKTGTTYMARHVLVYHRLYIIMCNIDAPKSIYSWQKFFNTLEFTDPDQNTGLDNGNSNSTSNSDSTNSDSSSVSLTGNELTDDEQGLFTSDTNWHYGDNVFLTNTSGVTLDVKPYLETHDNVSWQLNNVTINPGQRVQIGWVADQANRDAWNYRVGWHYQVH